MIPKDYACGGCGATRVKLWREYQTAAKYSKLLCGACAEADHLLAALSAIGRKAQTATVALRSPNRATGRS